MVTGNDNVTAVYPTSENEQYHSLYINKEILTMFDKTKYDYTVEILNISNIHLLTGDYFKLNNTEIYHNMIINVNGADIPYIKIERSEESERMKYIGRVVPKKVNLNKITPGYYRIENHSLLLFIILFLNKRILLLK